MDHMPVMYAESLQQLAIKEDGVYLDCTFGRGGHSRGILQALGESGRLLALDRDWQAITSNEAEEMRKDDRFTLIQCRFSELENIVVQQGWLGLVDGVLMDVGVSSPQLDDAQRGFSFLQDGPLDMRMDINAGQSAEQWLAKVREKELVKVLFEFGEERFARRIAKAVVDRREQEPITTTRQLAGLIEKAVPFREKHKHPATRSFQAIRIAINHELEELKQALDQAIRILKPGARLVVISFHSLEDRIVKRFFRNESRAKQDPGKLPVRERDIDQGSLKRIGKALRANKQEIDANPRARSAIMRVAEKK